MDDPLVTVFAGNGLTAEMEAQSVHGLLEANGIESVIVRDNVPEIPVGKVEVRVVASESARAEELIRQAQATGPADADLGEAESEL